MPKVAAKKSYRVEQTVDEDGVITETPVEDVEDDGKSGTEKRKAELLGILGELEKVVRVNAVSFGNEGRMDTGLLCLNQMMGGGLAPGMYVLVGPEQSAKTTAAITMAAASVDQETDIRCLWDAEGSSGSSIDYVANIFTTVGVKNSTIDTVFGVRENGVYTTVPMIYYRDDYEGDKFFNWVHGLEKRLPDKRFEDDQWWYVYDDSKDVMKIKAKLGARVDKKMTARNAGVWVKAEHGGLQAVIICDSIPALVPPSMDEEEGDNSIAVQARFLSKHIPRIKGALRAKKIALVFINQLRISPMVKYGSPEVEPGGNAPKFFCFSGSTMIQSTAGLLSGEELFRQPLNYKVLGSTSVEAPNLYDAIKRESPTEIFAPHAGWLKASPTHRVWALTKDPKGGDDPKVSWKTLSDIRSKGTFIAVRSGQEMWPTSIVDLSGYEWQPVLGDSGTESSKVTLPKVMTQELAMLMGLLGSDGFVRDNVIEFSNVEKEMHSLYVRLFKKTFGLKPTTHGRSTRIENACIGSFLRWLDMEHPAYEKRVSWAVRRSPRDIVISYLRGFFAGDSAQSRAEIHLGSASRTLTQQHHLFLLNLGIRGKINTINKRSWNSGKDFSSIYLAGSDYIQFLMTLPPLRKAQKDLLKKATAGRGAEAGHLQVREDLGRVWSLHALKAITKGLIGSQWNASIFLSAYEELKRRAEQARTAQERKKLEGRLQSTLEFVQFTQEHGLTWTPVTSVTRHLPEEMLYDFNMPSHTVVTNGIVSHNSDVRLKLFPNAISSAPFSPKGEGQFETEPSVTYPGATDTYRYISVKTIKNKLSSAGGVRTTWLRLWVADGKGEARGYDPVFDCFYYLWQTGQVVGKRSLMHLNLAGVGEAKKSITWQEFKTIILGSKLEKAPILEKIGYKKDLNLRRGCLGQQRRGVSENLYQAWVATQLTKAREKAKTDLRTPDKD